MEKMFFSKGNCFILTDDSCCLDNEEQQALGISSVPCLATTKQLKKALKNLLNEREFVLFVGTAPSFSTINESVEAAAKMLDEEDKRFNAVARTKILNTSCFSGGLGFFVTWFARFLNAEPRTFDELEAFSLFLANHIAHFFIEPKDQRWNNLIYAPRTGPMNYDGGKFRGNKGVYDFIASDFRDHAYNPEEKVWICFSVIDESEEDEPTALSHAKNLARQIKRCCPDSRLDLSHRLMPHPVGSLSDSAIACFYLSDAVRPDEFGARPHEIEEKEATKKRLIARENITEITKISQAFRKHPCPKF